MSNMSKLRRGLAAAMREKRNQEVVLPSCGCSVILKKIPMNIWFVEGKLPDCIKQIIEGADFDEALDAPGAKLDLIKFMAEAVKYAFVDPVLVEGATGEDELDPSELDPADFAFVFSYATGTKLRMPIVSAAIGQADTANNQA